ncbi:adenylate kinase [Chlamydiifrater phoenicopteri]|uniref:adenylate kinase n=1 Tax=Chlamydiifrater phoenicopteri TaxID=2681469 RepID=UPI001BD06664|nr:adenylate kinase [Chlamydiifrater phoenicopteri]
MSESKVVILMGPPGCGKGTQSSRISQKTGKPHISSGNLFRENIANSTPLGEKVAECISKGLLVPDDLVISMIEQRVNEPDCKDGYIIDGFPRTVRQAEQFSQSLLIKGCSFIVLNIKISDQEVYDRLTSRITCSSCGQTFKKGSFSTENNCPVCQGALVIRKDDNAEVIKQRLKTYQEETFPIIAFYATTGRLVEIDGSGDEEEVFSEVLKNL